MTDSYDAYEQRVRERAHEIWLREGQPDGRAEDHWALAREEISEKEGLGDTLKPIDDAPLAEPLLAVEGMADLPGRQLDQGEKQDYPSRRTAPEGKATAAPKAAPSKRKSAAL